jgi:uncharacterized protein (DUF2147 family)
MKKTIVLITIFLFSTGILLAQDVVGKWKTIDDNSGEAKSIVEVYKKDGKVYGKIIEILNPAKKGVLCTECTGADKDKPVEGLVFIRGLKKDGDEYNSGIIIDPENGKEYKCYITLEGADKLKVRGYIGFSLIGRTQYWQRVK